MRCDSNETYWDDRRNEADDIITAEACQELTEEELDDEVEKIVLNFIDNSLPEGAAKVLNPIFKNNPSARDRYVDVLNEIVMMGLKDKIIGRAA
ncbi:hypothetical protein Xsto_04145 [Xenorhabdus stockiae]|uniref:Uncharacterized protein n=1 Tax=Xenorhabdus stockiae TaxID=351614 RepID=A0A2D0K3N1_9GAMM|nr:hypothetical protein [Xenorhabdus stockiae]PHM56698.1 hypothetical protein Xsto_04145 [Xenorhabdus stockiae]